MPELTAVTMPDRDTLMHQLIEAGNSPHAIEYLYPRICDNLADQEQYSLGILSVLESAIVDYAAGLLLSVLVNTLMNMKIYITAITPESIRQETLDHWAHIQQS